MIYFIYYLIVFHFSFFTLINERESFSSKKIVLSHHFGQEKLSLHKKYKTLLGDEIELTRFSYYLSNIELTDEKGKIWKENESYHYIHIKENNKIAFEIQNVPNRKFKKISFSIGVDANRNAKGAQIGALDPLNGMFWTWSQGYVFLKAEGYCYHGAEDRRGLILHIGSNECYRTLSFGIADTSDIQFKIDAQKLFGGFAGASLDLKIPNNSSINIMGGAKAPKIADNYAKMFALD